MSFKKTGDAQPIGKPLPAVPAGSPKEEKPVKKDSPKK